MVHEVPLLSCVAQRDTQCWKGMNDDAKAASITHFRKDHACSLYSVRVKMLRQSQCFYETKTLDMPSDNVRRDEETFDR